MTANNKKNKYLKSIEKLKRAQKGLFLITTEDVARDINSKINAVMNDYCEQVQKLQAENKKLKEALRFYAKKEEWCSEGQGDVEIISCQDLEEVGSHLVGGKLARKTLREVEGE